MLHLSFVQAGHRQIRLGRLGRKPVHVVQLDVPPTDSEFGDVREWLRINEVARLIVAGPRESKRPGVYKAARVA